MRGEFLSFRSWIIFIGTEAILASVLWMMGLPTPVMLLLFGAALLFGLWVWDHRPNWIPSWLRQRLGWVDRQLGTTHASDSQATIGDPEARAVWIEIANLANSVSVHGHRRSKDEDLASVQRIKSSGHRMWDDRVLSVFKKELIEHCDALFREPRLRDFFSNPDQMNHSHQIWNLSGDIQNRMRKLGYLKRKS